MSFYKNKPISQWAVEDRPREKFQQKGAAALTDAELIALLLGTGSMEYSALDTARALIEQFPSLVDLSVASISEFMTVKGIGKAKAIKLIAAFELARRKDRVERTPTKLTCSKDIARYMQPRLADLPYEVLYLLCVDQSNRLIGERELSRGGRASTVMDVRVIMKEAILMNATGFAVVHNHPSGKARPSQMDVQQTHNLKKASYIIDIRLLDHVIVTRGDYYSFADEGRI